MGFLAPLFLLSHLTYLGARPLLSTQDSLVLYWQLPSLDTERVEIKGKEYLSVRGPERPMEPGVPNLPGYTLWFALPPGSFPEVHVFPGRSEIVSRGIPLLPVPEFREDGLTAIYPEESPKAMDGSKHVFLSGPEVSYLRHQRVARVKISPFYYEVQKKTLSVTREAKIVIRFKPGAPERPYFGPDPFENLYKLRLLNYEMGKNWRVESPSLSWENPFEGSQVWVKIEITKEGLYAIKGEKLERLGIPMGLSSSSYRLFSLGADTLPSPVDSANIKMREVGILLEDGGDGSFDKNDRVLFYGIPSRTRVWHGNGFLFFENPYSDTSSYWLGIFSEGEALRMDSVDVSPGEVPMDSVLTTATQYFRHEKNLYNVGLKGIRWEGEIVERSAGTYSNDTTFVFDLPGLYDASGQLSISVVGGSDLSRYVEFSINDSILDTVFIYGLKESKRFYFPENLRNTENRLKIKVIARSPTETGKPDYVYLDYFEISYTEELSYDGGQRKVYFHNEPEGLQLLSFKGSLPEYMLELTDPFHPDLLVSLKPDDGGFSLKDSIFPGKRYYLVEKVEEPQRISLRTSLPPRIPKNADMIVITPREISYGLSQWVSYKEQNLYLWSEEDSSWVKKGGEVWVVPIEDIFDAFGYGRRDPVSLRNFLKFQSDAVGSPPTYLLLLGDGHFDYRGYITLEGNLVPPWEPFEVFDVNSEMDGATEDFFGDMDWTGSGLITSDIFIGRIPVRTASQAVDYFRKSMRYEKGEANGPWRNRALFVADDEFAEDNSGETFHTKGANEIYVNHTPPTIEADKVYLIEYMPVSERGRLGHDALVETFNRGALIAVGFMHGNPVTMTHEHIFQAPIDYPLIDAGPRNPLWIIASCKISAFDRITPPAVIGEDWALRSGGSIGVISSTTLSYASPNETYSKRIFDQLSGYEIVPQGVLCGAAKNSENDLYYILLGDPSVPIGYPSPSISLEVEGENASGTGLKDTLFLGYEAKFWGKGVEGSRVYVRSFEKEKDTTYYGPTVEITYRWIPRPFFSGTAYKVEQDSVSGAFFVPFNLETTDQLGIPYLSPQMRLKGEGPLSKRNVDGLSSTFGASLILYDPSGLSGYVGVRKPLWIKSSEFTPFDTLGPNIKVFWREEEIVDSIYVPAEVEIKAEISDAHGINTTEYLPGGEKGIVYILDAGAPEALVYDFNYYPGTDTIGAARIRLNLGSGTHELRVKAYDNLGNFSDRKVFLTTASVEALRLWDVLAYPNPVRKDGPVYFTFRVNQEVKAEVKVFTLAGRLVWKSGTFQAAPGFNRKKWHGLDLDGDPLSNGLYLFKVSVSTPGEEGVSRVEKLLIAR